MIFRHEVINSIKPGNDSNSQELFITRYPITLTHESAIF